MDFIRKRIRDIPGFPKKGIVFKDITPLLQDPGAFQKTIGLLAERFSSERIDCIVAAESRGFIFGAPLALKLNARFVPVRKPGKLPFKTISVSYDLEYGTDTVEMHEDGIKEGERVLIVDDLLATGGTVEACCKLVERLGGRVVGCSFVIELGFLKGRERLKNYRVSSLVNYERE